MPHLTETQLALLIASFTLLDPRTVKKHLRGEPVRESVRERIDIAIRQHPSVMPAALIHQDIK